MADHVGSPHLGKIPESMLKKHVLSLFGKIDEELVVGPSMGIDFSAIRMRDGFLIISTDPVSGAGEEAGWYAVNVCANDVATSGSRPRYISTAILLPERAKTSLLASITNQVSAASQKLGIRVVGGHTEFTPGLRSPIVVGTAFALAESFVTAGDAHAGDDILMTKTAGIEGTSILTRQLGKGSGLDGEHSRLALGLKEKISVVEEATAAFGTGFVRAMHDPTEGGILGGIYEMSVASNVGFEVHENLIPISDETKIVCEHLKLDPLKLISSGVLIMAVKPEGSEEITHILESKNIRVSEVGSFSFKEKGRKLIRSDGRRERVFGSPMDELWRFFGAKRKKES